MVKDLHTVCMPASENLAEIFLCLTCRVKITECKMNMNNLYFCLVAIVSVFSWIP